MKDTDKFREELREAQAAACLELKKIL